MTPAHTDSPLRRSEAHLFRGDTTAAHNVTINDDEAERREARRRSMQQAAAATPGADSTAGSFEDNETLKKCLEMYNGNKMSKENAWSLSLIDTLATLLDRHHKSFNNFKVAGSSLEASSKVYGLRVDSIHNDVLRMSAGLNAQKFAGRNIEDDDDEDIANEGNAGAEPGAAEGAAGDGEDAAAAPAQKAKPKRQRKPVATVTKNKETLNARLDTVPLQDPVFGKLNTIVGSINSSNRLMNNILPTVHSELRLCTNFQFWDKRELPLPEDHDESIDFMCIDVNALHKCSEYNELSPCDRLFRVENFDELELRPMHSGYVISDTPEAIAEDKDNSRRLSMESNDGRGADFDAPMHVDDDAGAPAAFQNDRELSMAFDLNAECEPMPLLSQQAPMLDVDFGDFDEITTEERTAINNCRGLRKAPVLIEDLRPVDASSNLEYSYRPIDKISQFWAGPSHWKFKKARTRPSALGMQQQQDGSSLPKAVKQRGRANRNQAALQKRKQINFGEVHDNLFIKLDDKYKARKVNVQKKWDQRKLKLPTDLHMDHMIFFRYKLAPGLHIPFPNERIDNTQLVSEHNLLEHAVEGGMMGVDDGHHFGDDDDVFLRPSTSTGVENNMNISSMSAQGFEGPANADTNAANDVEQQEVGNDTILEIGTDFEGAPSQVTKIIVPFAKRAKVIDMKNLKRTCTQLLNKQLRRPVVEAEVPKHPIAKDESYAEGVASFKEIYEKLPDMLNKAMADSLSTSVAFYSILHLANDYSLRLIPQQDLEDFQIRQVRDHCHSLSPAASTSIGSSTSISGSSNRYGKQK